MTNIEPYSFDVGNQCFDCIYSKWIYVGCETCFVKTKNKRHIDRYCPDAPIEHIEIKTECPDYKSEIEDLKAERDRWHVLANNLQDARVGDLILREELQAVIDKLPKCWRILDGELVQDVPIVPDMLVYIIVGEHIDERRVVGPYGQKALLIVEPERHGSCRGTRHILVEHCHSTREAAEAAMKDK